MRSKLSATLLILALAGGACSTEKAAAPEAAPSTPGETPPTAVEGKTLERSISEAVAERLISLNATFNETLAGWLDGSQGRGTARWDELEITGLRKQKVMRRLARYPNLAAKVIPELPAGLRKETKTNVAAARRLTTLVTPLKPPVKMKTSHPKTPVKLRGFYARAERRFGVPWYVLASVNFVESKFGRLQGPSSAGAQGPMQFMPATWDAYGAGGNVWDEHDAIMGAARYLSASGAPERMRDALWAYNHSDAYVDAILLYANEMRRDERRFYSYYFWQVFVRTTEGDLQLTGPGAP
jgi:membrane-bound lytic murein transglycosylase B